MKYPPLTTSWYARHRYNQRSDVATRNIPKKYSIAAARGAGPWMLAEGPIPWRAGPFVPVGFFEPDRSFVPSETRPALVSIGVPTAHPAPRGEAGGGAAH